MPTSILEPKLTGEKHSLEGCSLYYLVDLLGAAPNSVLESSW
jgi:hypothetical protein